MRGLGRVKSRASGWCPRSGLSSGPARSSPPVSVFIEGKASVRGIIGLVGPAGYSSRAPTHTHAHGRAGGREGEGRELPVQVNFTHIQPGDKLSRYQELKATFSKLIRSDRFCSPGKVPSVSKLLPHTSRSVRDSYSAELCVCAAPVNEVAYCRY